MDCDKTEKQKDIPCIAPGDTCPCKRTHCERWGDCAACYCHHHLPGKKLLTACERQKAKKTNNKKREKI